jgi:hypothetical protein
MEPDPSKRGKNNRLRGLAIQRSVLKSMGLEHIPGNGQVDGRSIGDNALHTAEVKSGGRFNETDWSDIMKLPNDKGQARWLVKVETPGPGKRRRVTVTTVLQDWQGLFVGAQG